MDGFAIGHGVDLYKLHLDRFCHFMWWILSRNSEDESSIATLKQQLWRPPPGTEVTDPRSPWYSANEASAFGSLKASLGV